MNEKMTSGEIAKKSGVSQKAIRLYDEKGLLKPSDYSEGNYRLYDTEALFVLEKIIALKTIGFSLEEIRENLKESEGKSIEETLRQQLKIMDGKRYQLEKAVNAIRAILERAEQLDWDSVAEITQSISRDQKADEGHYQAITHVGDELDWYIKIFRSLNIRENEKVLDLGCGYSKLWRNNWEDIPQGVKVFGYDMHGSWADDFAGFVGENESKLPQDVEINLNWFDVETQEAWDEIEKQDNYSMIIAHYLYDFLHDPERFLSRVRSVLASDGVFSFNGDGISRRHFYMMDLFKECGVTVSSVEKIIEEETKKREHLKSLLGEYFGRIEIVTLPSGMHYSDSEEFFDQIVQLYPEQKKEIEAKKARVIEALEKQIQENGEILVDISSEFFRCYC